MRFHQLSMPVRCHLMFHDYSAAVSSSNTLLFTWRPQHSNRDEEILSGRFFCLAACGSLLSSAQPDRLCDSLSFRRGYDEARVGCALHQEKKSFMGNKTSSGGIFLSTLCPPGLVSWAVMKGYDLGLKGNKNLESSPGQPFILPVRYDMMVNL